MAARNNDTKTVTVLFTGAEQGSLPADVGWGSFVTHSFISPPTDVCGEAKSWVAGITALFDVKFTVKPSQAYPPKIALSNLLFES